MSMAKDDDFLKNQIIASGMMSWLAKATATPVDGVEVIAMVAACILSSAPAADDTNTVKDFSILVEEYLKQMRTNDKLRMN